MLGGDRDELLVDHRATRTQPGQGSTVGARPHRKAGQSGLSRQSRAAGRVGRRRAGDTKGAVSSKLPKTPTSGSVPVMSNRASAAIDTWTEGGSTGPSCLAPSASRSGGD